MSKALRRQARVEHVEEIEAPEENLAIGQWYWLKWEEELRVTAAQCTPAQWKAAAPKKSRDEDENEDEEYDECDSHEDGFDFKLLPEELREAVEKYDEARAAEGELYEEADEDEDVDDEDDDEPVRRRRSHRSEPSEPEPEQRYVTFERESFVCIVQLGSNFVRFRDRHDNTWKIHFDDLASLTRRERDPDRVIDQGRADTQHKMNALMDDVKETMRRLGVTERDALVPATGATLARVSDGTDPKQYKADLIKAKEVDLPRLFKQLEEAGKELGRWLAAPTIPLKAQADAGKDTIRQLDERIFSVELYAGLIEQVEKVRDGKAAEYHEKIHLIQRLHYMDEECLLDYKAGGMDFKNIRAFEKWLCKKSNFDRIFPFPRTLVAFRVRRTDKDYDFSGWRSFIKFAAEGWAEANKSTFLYIRNGEQLFCLSTKIEFGSRMFPNSSEQVLATRKVWVCPHIHGRPKVLSDEDYQALKEEEIEEYKAKLSAWKLEEKQYKKDKAIWDVVHERWAQDHKKWKRAYKRWRAKGTTETYGNNGWTRWVAPEEPAPVKPKEPPKPYLRSEPYKSYDHVQYTLLDPQSVDYDDLMKDVTQAVKQYNKIALLLQGLLDRSPVLHPHPGWKIFTASGLEAAVTLVYDQDRSITAGPPPDFEAYREQLNRSIRTGNYTVGQDDYWARIEAKKKNERHEMNDDYFDKKRYRPFGNPGPGDVAKVVGMAKGGAACRYTWKRERLRDKKDRWGDVIADAGEEGIRCHLTVPKSELLNVSAYTPGDYVQFFEDPRTREDYLQWAPLMLTAEDWYAERRKKQTKKQEGEET